MTVSSNRSARIKPWVVTSGAVALAATLVACSGGEPQGQSDDSGKLRSVKVAWSTSGDAYVPQSQGPWRFGEMFGLDQKRDDITELSSHATAVQLLLSNRAEVVTGSFTAFVKTIQEGHDIRLFCPIQGVLTDEVVGTGDVTTIEQVTDPNVSVAVDSPGGLVDHVFNHVFASKGLDIVVADLPNVQILEDGGLRLAALASGEAQVAVLDPFELAQLQKQRDDVHTLSVVAEDMDSVGFVYAATKEWLDNNQDRAAAFCASVLEANEVAIDDIAAYTEWSNEAMDPDPAAETLEVNWSRAKEFGVWPVDIETLSEPTVETDLAIAVKAGQLNESALELKYEDIVDIRPAEKAIELVNAQQ
ncbi:ABC transporter substrate-binding protein [Mycobacterium sp. ITM-2016-00317]|uniref:ABC transporter substrate-binding protein n=1 Tax=Mycobacterium sp. ITM-2016-00317 TaxID=2099694 RepID=UPI00287F9972|nr:ABC transporter substrate-binding protein [Mycobacterium sp. ITM-2016-00317]WNG85867.1 ABC transporter substrate-binding protein [Mycobacterium sp. ITM-2016-00317]